MNCRLSRARAIALLGASCAALPKRSLAQSEPPIRVAAGLADSYAEPFFALDGGFFARAGLPVDVGIGDPINVAHPVNAASRSSFWPGAGSIAPRRRRPYSALPRTVRSAPPRISKGR